MQRLSRRWLLRWALVPVLVVVAGCTGLGRQAMVPPQVTLADLNPRAFGLFEQRVALTLRVVNPNDRAIDIDGFRYTLTLNGQPFASGVSQVRARVPRLGEAFVETEASISTLNLLRQLSEAQTLNGFSYAIEGVAFVRTGAGTEAVPFSQAGALGRLPGANTNPQAPRFGGS